MNQKKLWNSQFSQKPSVFQKSKFASEVLPYFPPQGNVLEIGCGLGRDSIFFAKHGYTVMGVDLSDVAINKNKEKFKKIPHLSFMQCDVAQGLPFKNSEFDVVYARLSLHYFTDKVTQEVFTEIRRVLSKNGVLCFECKTVKDSAYGKGEQIEPDMYSLVGHIRHFFSSDYVTNCLKNKFQIVKLEEGNEFMYDRDAAFIKAIARKL
jgi:ubiquinone/menaquinone biosynthesis C-methylase UbiE